MATGERPTSSTAPLSTYAITRDPIVAIVADGVEDVFDVEVATTENFIANGLVSHNTRWHPDDLIGRLSKETTDEGKPAWEVINLPAILENGQPLWHQRPLKFLEEQRRGGEYDWWSLWMGSPRPRGSSVFRGTRFYDALPTVYRIGKGTDLAYTAKTQSDWSVGLVLLEEERVDALPLYYVVDVRRQQVDAPTFADELAGVDVVWPGTWHWFCSTTERGVAQLVTKGGVHVDGVLATADKFVRSQKVAAAWNEGRVLVPRHAQDCRARVDSASRCRGDCIPWLKAFVDEVGAFTGVGDRRDDQIDALASAFESLLNVSFEYDASFDDYLPAMRV